MPGVSGSPIFARQIDPAAALHAVTRPHRSIQKHRSPRVTVVPRIRINQTAHRAVLGGELRLDAAPQLAYRAMTMAPQTEMPRQWGAA